MGRLRRFEKIEGAREGREREPPREPAARPRFEATEPTATAAPALQALTDDERHQAMEHLLATLPTLECPACLGENSKFSAVCRLCGHALDGDDGVAHNLRRHERWETERLRAEVDLERHLNRAVAPRVEEPPPTPPGWTWLPATFGQRVVVMAVVGLLLVGPLLRWWTLNLVGALLAAGLIAWRLRGGARR
jgi:hypothetical protein